MPDPHCFDGLCSSTFAMLFNVALFSSLLLVPAALAVPSALGASLARHREGRQSQLNSRLQQRDPTVSNTQYSTTLAGAVLAEGNVRSTGNLFCDRHRSHPDLVSYYRELSTRSRGRSPSPAHRVRSGLLPSLGLVSMVSLPVKVVLSRPLSFSPFLPMVPNTVVREHLTHIRRFSYRSFHEQPGMNGNPILPTNSQTLLFLLETSSDSLPSRSPRLLARPSSKI
jgi:hypothetical protein